MAKIGIVVDSPADFPDGMTDKLGVHVLPVHIYVDGRDFRHGIDISNQEVVDYLKKQRDVSTKPFFPGECAEFYENLTDRYDKIFSFHVSSQLSGCFNSAINSVNLLPAATAKKIKIIDTGCVSISEGLFVKHAVEQIRRNNRFDHIDSILEPQRRNCSMWFTVDNLYWLKRSGRINALGAFMGRMLDIKPIIGLDQAQLIPMEKHRGKSSAIQKMLRMTAEAFVAHTGACEIWVAHADDMVSAVSARDQLADMLGKTAAEIKLMEVGPTIAAHTGPGSMCIAVIPKKS